MEQKNCGKIHCGNCEKVVGFFPLDNEPKEKLEVYCETCLPEIDNALKPGNVTYLKAV